MLPARVRFARYATGLIDLKGGVNENVSSLELKAGELILCKNYMIAEGGYGGYMSVAGYERYDGKGKPSALVSYLATLSGLSGPVAIGDNITTASLSLEATEVGTVLSGSYVGNDAVVLIEVLLLSGTFTVPETALISAVPIGTLDALEVLPHATDEHHSAIEYRRAQVVEVPGELGILASFVFNGLIYAFRKKAGVAQIGLYKEDATTGWVEVSTALNPIVYSAGMNMFEFSEYNFGATPSTNSIYWVDGVNKCRAFDGTTVTMISNPGAPAGVDAPTKIVAFNQHLHLAYRGGTLHISTLGDPTDWTTDPTLIGVGAEITNMVVGVSTTLIVYLQHGIRILSGTSSADFVMNTHSDRSGAYSRTAVRLLGTHFFLDDRGLTTLEAVDTFGDYATNSISQRFKKTLLSRAHEVTTAFPSRDNNQYRIFFNDRVGIFVSFEGKELKGATFVEYNKVIDCVFNGRASDGRELITFCSNGDGFVYIMDSGTSFDGEAITTIMQTAFYHYNSPRQLKGFKKITTEIDGETGQLFFMRMLFEYNERGAPASIVYEPTVYTIEGKAIYGESLWGSMVYGSAGFATNRVPLYVNGIATNMSLKIITSEAYKRQHIVQNVIVDYTILNRRI